MKYYFSKHYPIEIVKTENGNKEFKIHNHVGHYVISFVSKGKVEAYINGTTNTYMQGEMFWIAPMKPHAVYVEKGAEMISVCIDSGVIEKWNSDKLSVVLFAILEKINTLSYCCLNYRKALSEIYDSNIDNKEQPENSLRRVVDKIVETPEKNVSIDKMAQESYMSKYYFVRRFKDSTGITPHQFCMQNRIRKAQKLLRKKSAVADVATEMGFYDQSHFDKCFKKIVGISPQEYRISENVI